MQRSLSPGLSSGSLGADHLRQKQGYNCQSADRCGNLGPKMQLIDHKVLSTIMPRDKGSTTANMSSVCLLYTSDAADE